MTKRIDYPSPETRYEAALEEVKQKLQTGKLHAKSTSFERRVVDIPALRERYDMTQQQFADAFGIAIGTLRNWEQGRRVPDGPAQKLLEIIEDRPILAADVFGNPRTSDFADIDRPDDTRQPSSSEQTFAAHFAAHLAAKQIEEQKGGGGRQRVDVHVGQRVRQRRWMVGMTQQQLGDSIGVRFQQIQKYETGANRITASHLWALADVMMVPVSFFFEGLGGQADDVNDIRGDIFTKKEKLEIAQTHKRDLEIIRAYFSIPEERRRRVTMLATALFDAG